VHEVMRERSLPLHQEPSPLADDELSASTPAGASSPAAASTTPLSPLSPPQTKQDVFEPMQKSVDDADSKLRQELEAILAPGKPLHPQYALQLEQAQLFLDGTLAPARRKLNRRLRKGKCRPKGSKKGKKRGTLRASAVARLRQWLFENFEAPYPTEDEKNMLARETGLEPEQVNYWFINNRVRLWKAFLAKFNTRYKEVTAQFQSQQDSPAPAKASQ